MKKPMNIVALMDETEPSAQACLQSIKALMPDALFLFLSSNDAQKHNMDDTLHSDAALCKMFANGNDTLFITRSVLLFEGALAQLRQAAYAQPNIAAVQPLHSVDLQSLCPELPEKAFTQQAAAHTAAMLCHCADEIPIDVGVLQRGCVYLRGDLFVPEVWPAQPMSAEEKTTTYLENMRERGYCTLLAQNVYAFCLNKEQFSQDISQQHHALYDLRSNLLLFVPLFNGRKNILYLLQNDFAAGTGNNIGGTQLHVKDLTQALCNQYNILVAARNGENLRLTLYTDKISTIFHFTIGGKTNCNDFFSAMQQAVYAQILDAFCVDIVHIHHTMNLSLDLFYEAKKRKLPLMMTIHDYYTLCPTLYLLDEQDKLCIGDNRESRCDACLKKRRGMSNGGAFITHWRTEMEQAMALCDHLFVPSVSTKNVISSTYPQLAHKILVIPHGVSLTYTKLQLAEPVQSERLHCNLERVFTEDGTWSYDVEGWCYLENVDSRRASIFVKATDEHQNVEWGQAIMFGRVDVAQGNQLYLNSGFLATVPVMLMSGNQLRVECFLEYEDVLYTNGECVTVTKQSFPKQTGFGVGFIGGLSMVKGARLAAQMITKSGNEYQWSVFGGLDDASLRKARQKNLFKYGWYQRDRLPELLQTQKIDVICLLPMVSETFCYTLSEALLCGKPVIVTDIGALGERVRDMDCGWVIPVDATAEDVLSMLQYLRENPNEFARVQQNVNRLQLRTVEEMTQQYATMYENQTTFPRNAKFSKLLIKNAAVQNKKETQDTPQAETAYIRLLEQELQSIRQSFSYRMLRKVLRLIDCIKNKLFRMIKG
ncbi:MAG: glycosyltransferase [Ruthenibacterium sp.]